MYIPAAAIAAMVSAAAPAAAAVLVTLLLNGFTISSFTSVIFGSLSSQTSSLCFYSSVLELFSAKLALPTDLTSALLVELSVLSRRASALSRLYGRATAAATLSPSTVVLSLPDASTAAATTAASAAAAAIITAAAP
eukprot:11751-Heterococcus_DN1.PRE.5